MSSNSCLLQEMGQRLSDEILYYLEIQELLDFEEENSFKYVNDCLFVAFVCVCVCEREREREREGLHWQRRSFLQSHPSPTTQAVILLL